MSGYRRFVAYVYEYRKGKKGNNCGYVKVEVRDARCTMDVHLQCAGLPPEVSCRAYGFLRKDGLMNGILLGSCKTLENGISCVLETDAGNMGNSGMPLERMGGMIFLTDMGSFFGTEWDDEPIRPENFHEMKIRAEEPEEKPAENVPEIMKREKAEEAVQPKEIEGENRLETEGKEAATEMENTAPADLPETDCADSVRNRETEESANEIVPEADAPEMKQEDIPEPKQESIPEENQQDMTATEIEPQEGFEDGISPESIVANGALTEEAPVEGMSAEETPAEEAAVREASTEMPSPDSAPSGQKARPLPGEEYMPFEDGGFLWCRKIRPEDIPCISRKNCALRQNRFVLYGYYHFGHLLFCRRTDGQFLLGVPGSYDQQERFMANMFGFPYFKKSRLIELPGDRGGYWYRLIDAADFH